MLFDPSTNLKLQIADGVCMLLLPLIWKGILQAVVGYILVSISIVFNVHLNKHDLNKCQKCIVPFDLKSIPELYHSACLRTLFEILKLQKGCFYVYQHKIV